MAKVIVGLSGGVDSAVCAYLLKEQGYEVIGVTLRTWLNAENEVSKCCEIEDARRIAMKLGIAYHIHNVGADFCKYVTAPFVEEYKSGRTPSPCVECNRYVKFAGMQYVAGLLGAEYIATGHYAKVVRLDNGRYAVQCSPTSKDQAYMLYKLSQEQLSGLILPLGDFTKDEVRKIAADAGIPVAEKPDSQEICFVEDGCYAQYVRERIGEDECGPGNFVDEEGNVLGRHKGIIHYTIGQRKGLGIAFGHPVYVKEIRPETNEVVLSEEEKLFSKEVICGDLNFQSIPDLEIGVEMPAKVKVRYRHSGTKAFIRREEANLLRILFEEPVRAATPGQSAVFYDDNHCVIGGGVIRKA